MRVINYETCYVNVSVFYRKTAAEERVGGMFINTASSHTPSCAGDFFLPQNNLRKNEESL